MLKPSRETTEKWVRIALRGAAESAETAFDFVDTFEKECRRLGIGVPGHTRFQFDKGKNLTHAHVWGTVLGHEVDVEWTPPNKS